MFPTPDVTWQRFTYGDPIDLRPIGDGADDAEYFEMDMVVVPDWNVSVYLEWIPPEDLSVGAQYRVFYSESEAGPFTQLTEQPITDTSYFTTFQVQDSKVYEQYFTIELIAEDGKRYRSYPKTPQHNLSKWHILRHKDIIRREAILLEKFVGADTVIFTRKWRGRRCPVCWDETHKKVMDDHCESCYGTSYENGYDTGMRTKLQYTSIDPQNNFTYNGTQEPVTISAWGLPFPLLHPDAIVCRMDDRKIFRVEGHQGSTEMLTNMQRQNVILRELGRDSIETKLFHREDIIDIPLRTPHVHH